MNPMKNDLLPLTPDPLGRGEGNTTMVGDGTHVAVQEEQDHHGDVHEGGKVVAVHAGLTRIGVDNCAEVVEDDHEKYLRDNETLVHNAFEKSQ